MALDSHAIGDADCRPLSAAGELDVFHDDHAVDEDHMVADGFMPNLVSPAPHEPRHASPTAQRITFGSRRTSSDRIERRGSMRKSMSGMENPFASAEDGDAVDRDVDGTHVRYAPYPLLRPLSSASSNVFAQSHNLTIDSSGPSHPYSMYPQGTGLERTMSGGNTEHIRRSSIRSNSAVDARPTHPYAMYPQTVEQDIDDHDSSERPSPRRHIAPVGFPGSLRRLQRDRDTDAVSINTEQLPPYSEYPDGGVPKPPTPSPPSRPVSPRAPGQAHVPLLINIPPQSMSDARDHTSDLPRVTDRLLDDVPTTPMLWREKSWKQKRKTKFCGVPFGRILIGLIISVLVVAVLGGSIGGVYARQSEKRAKFQASLAAHNGWKPWRDPDGSGRGTSKNGTYSDAAPIPQAWAPALPVGNWGVKLGGAEEVLDECLPESQAVGWNCDLFDADSLTLQIDNVSNSQGAFIFPSSSSDGYGFGTRAPSTVLSILQLVRDKDNLNYGMAHQFQVLYNKLVVLPESTFGPSSAGYTSKRDTSLAHSKRRHARRDFLAGEKPWFCYWNGTLLEGFVYLDEAKSEPTNSSSSTASSMSAASACTTHESATGTGTREASESGSTACASEDAQQTAADHDSNLYPGNIKFEERRIAGSPSPYCQQMQVLENGDVSPCVNQENGNPITINLQENDPSAAAYASMEADRGAGRGLVSGSCHCQWFTV